MYVICHYSEIGLKGNNRDFFEKRLVGNIEQVIEGDVRRISGRLLIELDGAESKEEVKNKLKNIPGVAYFAFAYSADQNIESIRKKAVDILEEEQFNSFRVTTKRSNKRFELTSQEISEKVGAKIVEAFDKEVDLENYDLNLRIEIVENYAFLYLERVEGVRGLPVGVSGKVISLLSGGIDSPVASYYAMKRGMEVVFIHFSSYPFTEKKSVEKAEKIVNELNKFQFNSKLYVVPFSDVQQQILTNCEASFRVILYRRFMLRIAERIAERENAKALLTGESVGQVASQTLENMRAVEAVANLPVLRPLVGMSKEEIINDAKQIGTYNISILPAEDCCQRFIPEYPETKADLNEVEKEEEKVELEELIEDAIEGIEEKEI
ncbi:MAG: tRNA uracil 4-sulfurtransferase ThiI [Candidatus Paceibacterota bacterium]